MHSAYNSLFLSVWNIVLKYILTVSIVREVDVQFNNREDHKWYRYSRSSIIASFETHGKPLLISLITSHVLTNPFQPTGREVVYDMNNF